MLALTLIGIVYAVCALVVLSVTPLSALIARAEEVQSSAFGAAMVLTLFTLMLPWTVTRIVFSTGNLYLSWAYLRFLQRAIDFLYRSNYALSLHAVRVMVRFDRTFGNTPASRAGEVKESER